MPVVTTFSFPLHSTHEIGQVNKFLRKISVLEEVCTATLFIKGRVREAPIEMVPGSLRLSCYGRVANEELAATSRQKMKKGIVDRAYGTALVGRGWGPPAGGPNRPRPCEQMLRGIKKLSTHLCYAPL